MSALRTLPEGYREILNIDLQRDKKRALAVNMAALLMAAALGIGMHFLVPITTLVEGADSLPRALARPLVILVSYVAYIFLHEATHGLAMRCCGSKQIRYGITGIYAFAGSNDYYSKRAYLAIALAPVALWGIVLGVLCVLLPRDWFWVAWIVQIGNLSGAAGDFYVFLKFLCLPRDILVQDSGVGMKVYSAAP